MPDISPQDVKHIAKLARLRLDDREVQTMTGQLGAILKYIDKLAEVATEGVEPTAQVTGLENVMRGDTVIANSDHANERAISLDQFPDREGDFNKVKAILDRG